jgi:CRP/FNR family transcriptional regulator, cyclic AMP receptor protein
MSEYVNVKKDEILFEEGDFPECMYIIRTGQFKIYVVDGETEKELSVVGPGNLIGEMSLFDKKLRSASVKATADSSVIKLSYLQLEKQLDQMPDWVKITMKSMSEKLRLANKKIIEHV